MKSVENILGYIREQFYRFSRGCKPRENFWNCSRKYTKMFKTDSFLGNKKSSLNQNVWRDHATMQQDVLLHFWVIFFIKIRLKYEKIILLSSSRAFSLSTPTFSLSTHVDYSEATWKKATKYNKWDCTLRIDFNQQVVRQKRFSISLHFLLLE